MLLFKKGKSPSLLKKGEQGLKCITRSVFVKSERQAEDKSL